MDEKDKKSILLVEDQSIIAMAERMQLEEKGYRVVIANSGEEAIEKALSEQYELILMDIDLGNGISGSQAASEILSCQEIPILFLTSHTEPEVVMQTEEITSYGYVVKNSGIVVLDASMKMAFKLHESKVKEEKNNSKLESILENLHVHQEELRMQNDELQVKQQELEVLQSKYYDLYDLAPCGYFILNEQTKIIDSNLLGAEILDMPRIKLKGLSFSSFFSGAYQDKFYKFHKSIGSGNPASAIQLRLKHKSATSVLLTAKKVQHELKDPRLLIVMIKVESDLVNEDGLGNSR
jgi:DNA-binding response OmpR family regulator